MVEGASAPPQLKPWGVNVGALLVPDRLMAGLRKKGSVRSFGRALPAGREHLRCWTNPRPNSPAVSACSVSLPPRPHASPCTASHGIICTLVGGGKESLTELVHSASDGCEGSERDLKMC